MKNKIFNKNNLKYLLVTFIVAFIGITMITFFANASDNPNIKAATIETVSDKILANGSITAQTQATLNFQMGGKLIYLPFKEGDSVYQGAAIASLDSYALQKQLQLAANNYEISKNSTEQTTETQKAGALEGQQRLSLDTSNKNKYSDVTEVTLINDNVKRIVDNAQTLQNSAQINIDLANYALSLSSLTSPIGGILLRQDASNIGTNITPATTFIVADPNSKVFQANVRLQDVNFISVGNTASVLLDGSTTRLNGIVDKIYPQKITLANGDDVYKVDIKIDNMPKDANFGNTGSVLIKSNFNQKVMLVPSWTVLSNSYIWVMSNGKPTLKQVKVGQRVNSMSEIMSGLNDSDKVIENAQSLLFGIYHIL